MREFRILFGKRAAALGAVVALLFAGFAVLGTQQAAKAAITSPSFTVEVANVSPPAGGTIVYRLKWTEDSTATDYTVRVTNLANLEGCSGAVLSVSPGSPTVGSCLTGPFGSIYWSVTDDPGPPDPVTARVVLVVSSTAPVGATIQPTFTVEQGSTSVSVAAPARTVGARPNVTPAAVEAVDGQQVTLTFNLPPGWTCDSDPTVDAIRECNASDVTILSSPVTVTVGQSNLYLPSTVVVTGTASFGSTSVTLKVKYEGDHTEAGDNDTTPPYPEATLGVWLQLTTPATYSFAGGTFQPFGVAVANLTGQSAPPGTATVTVTFPPEFTSVSAPPTPPSGWNCGVSGLVLTCTNTGAFSANGTASFSGIAATLSPNTGSSARPITVAAQVTFTNLLSGPVTKSTSKSASQDVAGSVTITATPVLIPSAASSTVQWSVTVSSSGTAAAAFQFKAPPGTLGTGVLPDPDWSCTVVDAETVNCTRTTPLSGSNDPVGTFVTQVPANTAPSLVTRTATGTLTLTIGSTTYTIQGTGSVLHPGTGATNVTYNLVFGWNLITWGGQTTAVDGPNGLGSIVGSVSAVYTFDSASQTWLAWFPGGGPANSLTTLQTGTAYFIYVTSPAGATLTVPAGP